MQSSASYLFPFGKFETASYFVSLAYLLLGVSAVSTFIKIRKLVRVWNQHVVFHLGLLVLCLGTLQHEEGSHDTCCETAKTALARAHTPTHPRTHARTPTSHTFTHTCTGMDPADASHD
jgi:hypothetical protein